MGYFKEDRSGKELLSKSRIDESTILKLLIARQGGWLGLERNDDDDNNVDDDDDRFAVSSALLICHLLRRIIVAKMAWAPFWLKPENFLASVAAAPASGGSEWQAAWFSRLPANQRHKLNRQWFLV